MGLVGLHGEAVDVGRPYAGDLNAGEVPGADLVGDEKDDADLEVTSA